MIVELKKQKYLMMFFLIWLAAAAIFFSARSAGFPVPLIAEGAFSSLLFVYFPIVLIAVFLLLYLTRKRENVDWVNLYGVNKETAANEAWVAVIYLAVTQLILGFFLNTGLHFPGPEVYEPGSHGQYDVWLWALTYFVVYVVLPLVWLNGKGFSMKKLITSLNWRRDIWILVGYWCMDFFGPIFSGADFLGLTASQYAQGIPAGVLVNTLGAGLPVVVMMHLIFIPRIAVLIENKLAVIALGGLYYALFSLFDQGVDYSSMDVALMSTMYIIMTQMLVGMGKAAFTVVTGNPFIHFITLHVISARIPFDTKMYVEIFRFK
jgi:hypothetical protein